VAEHHPESRGVNPEGNGPREPLDQLVDRILDGEFDRTDSLRSALSRVSSDPEAERDLREQARAAGALAQTPEPPAGLADRVLDEVAVRRGFLNSAQRKLVTRGRLAAAALLFVAFGGLMLGYRASPAMFDVRQRPSPIAGFDDAVRREALPGAMASAQRLAGELERSTAPLIAVFRDGAVAAYPASTAPPSMPREAARENVRATCSAAFRLRSRCSRSSCPRTGTTRSP